MTRHGFGSAKLILLGEHVVVHGVPAIAAGLTRGVRAALTPAPQDALLVYTSQGEELFRVDAEHPPRDQRLMTAWAHIRDTFGVADTPFHVRLDLEVPLGAGLGASAALSVAPARAIATHVDGQEPPPQDPRVTQAVAGSEGAFHGQASGIDQAAAQYGGLFVFQRDTPRVPITAPPVTFAVCQAAPGASTAALVRAVGERRRRHPRALGHLEAMIAELVEEARRALESGDAPRLGELMDLNHGALVGLGVSTPDLDLACHMARAKGAHGAKLTGAGGGGCVVAVCEDPEPILARWRERFLTAFSVTLGAPEHA